MFVIVVEEGLLLAIMEGIGKLIDDRCAESQKTSIFSDIFCGINYVRRNLTICVLE